MSKLSEYSKFDHLDDDSCSDEGEFSRKPQAVATTSSASNHNNDDRKQPSHQSPSSTTTTTTKTTITPIVQEGQHGRMRKNKENGRFVYEYNGKVIYEWEQKLEDVTIYVPAPPLAIVPTKQIHCQIFPHRLELGIRDVIQTKGQYFIQEDTFGLVDVSESTWYIEKDENMIIIYLVKAKKGEVWDVALKGRQQDQQQGSTAASTTAAAAAATAPALDPFSKQEVQKELMLERFQEENPGMDFRGAEFNGSVPDPRTFMGGVKYS